MRGLALLGADPDKPELTKAATGLLARLAELLHGRVLTEERMRAVRRTVKDHATHCRSRGVSFPPLAILAFPVSGHLQLVSAEWDAKSIETNMINLAMAWPDVKPTEMARAVRRAFPHYHPSRCGFIPDLPQVIMSDGTRWN